MTEQLKKWWREPTTWYLLFVILFDQKPYQKIPGKICSPDDLQSFVKNGNGKVIYPEVLPVIFALLGTALRSIAEEDLNRDSSSITRNSSQTDHEPHPSVDQQHQGKERISTNSTSSMLTVLQRDVLLIGETQVEPTIKTPQRIAQPSCKLSCICLLAYIINIKLFETLLPRRHIFKSFSTYCFQSWSDQNLRALAQNSIIVLLPQTLSRIVARFTRDTSQLRRCLQLYWVTWPLHTLLVHMQDLALLSGLRHSSLLVLTECRLDKNWV